MLFKLILSMMLCKGSGVILSGELGEEQPGGMRKALRRRLDEPYSRALSSPRAAGGATLVHCVYILVLHNWLPLPTTSAFT